MDSWAIVVGINDYHPNAGQAPLSGAVADAADFADWALHANGGAVRPERLFFWTHPAPVEITDRLRDALPLTPGWFDLNVDPSRPTFNAPPFAYHVYTTILREAGRAMTEALDGDGASSRRCYVFFAGHGVQTNAMGATSIQTCFVLGDFRPAADSVIGLLPCDDLLNALLASGFTEVIMFLDCCRVSMTKLNMPAPRLPIANLQAPPSPVYTVGSAAQKDKVAYETTSAPIRGAFSKTLMRGLRIARNPNTQVLDTEMLRLFIRNNIEEAARPNKQSPSIIYQPDDTPLEIVRGPPIPVSQANAPIRIHFGNLPVDAVVQLKTASGDPIDGPITAPAGQRIVEILKPIGQFYRLDVVGTSTSRGILLAGSGGKDVEF